MKIIFQIFIFHTFSTFNFQFHTASISINISINDNDFQKTNLSSASKPVHRSIFYDQVSVFKNNFAFLDSFSSVFDSF